VSITDEYPEIEFKPVKQSDFRIKTNETVLVLVLDIKKLIQLVPVSIAKLKLRTKTKKLL